MPGNGDRRLRVSKDQWLAQALEELVREGIAAVRVERLARALAVAKSGFYWHFDGLDDLHRHLLDYWSSEYTGAIIARVEQPPREPRAQLEFVLELVEARNIGRYDFAMHGWAKQDAVVRAAVDEVMADRLAFISRIFARLGFSGDELDMRTRLFVCKEMRQKETYPSISQRHRARLRKLRLDFCSAADPASRAFHRRQAGWRTLPAKLWNILGTRIRSKVAYPLMATRAQPEPDQHCGSGPTK